LMRECDTVTGGANSENSAFVGSEEAAKVIGVVEVGRVVEIMTGPYAVVNGFKAEIEVAVT
jgi:hypothetical protein